MTADVNGDNDSVVISEMDEGDSEIEDSSKVEEDPADESSNNKHGRFTEQEASFDGQESSEEDWDVQPAQK